MKTLLIQLGKSENRLVRWCRDKRVLELLALQLQNDIIPLLQKAQAKPSDEELQIELFKSLGKFGITLFKLSRRNEQIRHLHPEFDWALLSGIANFFAKRRESKMLFTASECQDLADDCQLLLQDLGKLIVESEGQIIALKHKIAAYEHIRAVIKSMANVRQRLFDFLTFLDTVNYKTTAKKFIEDHRDATARCHADLGAELQLVAQHAAQQKLVDVQVDKVQKVVALLSQPEEFKHSLWVSNVESAMTQAHDNTELDVDADKGPVFPETKSQARFPKLAALLKSHLMTFILDYTLVEISLWKSVQAKRTALEMRDRLVLLRLLSLIGETSKILLSRDYDRALEPTLLAIRGIRDEVNHILDTEHGRGTIYCLLTTDSIKVKTVFQHATEVIARFADAIPAKHVSDELLDATQAFTVALKDFAADTSVKRTIPMDIFNSCFAFLGLADITLAVQDDYSRLACEFIITMMGQTCKPLEHNVLFHQLAAQNLLDLITHIVTLRNSLAHELIQGRTFQADVIPDLIHLITYRDAFLKLADQMRTELTIEKHVATPIEMRRNFAALTEHAQRAPGYFLKQKGANRERARADVKEGAKELLKLLIQEVLLAFPHLDPNDIGPELARLIQKTMRGEGSPTKFNIPVIVKEAICQHAQSPQRALKLQYERDYRELQSVWYQDCDEVDTVISEAGPNSTPNKNKRIHLLKSRLVSMARTDHLAVRMTGDFLNMLDVLVSQKLDYAQTFVSTPVRAVVSNDFYEGLSQASRELYAKSPVSPTTLAALKSCRQEAAEKENGAPNRRIGVVPRAINFDKFA